MLYACIYGVQRSPKATIYTQWRIPTQTRTLKQSARQAVIKITLLYRTIHPKSRPQINQFVNNLLIQLHYQPYQLGMPYRENKIK